MKRTLSAIGAVVFVSAFATTSFAATWKSIDLGSGSGGLVTTEKESVASYQAIIVRSLVMGGGVATKRASARSGAPAAEASSGPGNRFNPSPINNGSFFPAAHAGGWAAAPQYRSAGLTARDGALDGIGLNSPISNGYQFALFQVNADGNATGAAFGTVMGEGAFDLFMQPSTLYLLQAAGRLAANLSSALGLGPATVAGGYGGGPALVAAPLPPAVLGFLTALCALFAFRNMRRKSAEAPAQ